MPTIPRWLLTIPDALTQLQASDRPLLIRRDLEQLFRISKPQAAILMRRFGAEWTGHLRTLSREQLVCHLKALQQDATFTVEIDRHARFISSLRRARIARSAFQSTHPCCKCEYPVCRKA
jgi:hypothetical protein